MGKIKYKIKSNAPEIDVMEYPGYLSDEVKLFIGEQFIISEERNGVGADGHWVKAVNGKKMLSKGLFLVKNIEDNFIHAFDEKEFHELHELLEELEEELEVCQASPDYQRLCVDLEQEVEILKEQLSNMGSSEMQKSIKLSCLDLATKTNGLDSNGRLQEHTAKTLIESAELIYKYINK